jgi:hypothetical protein
MMNRTSWLGVTVLTLLIASIAVARDARQEIITERILFRSGTEDFNEVYPVTEHLNQILSEITRVEVEAGRDIPNFVVYPYDESGAAQPYALLWDRGAYTMSERLPAEGTTFLIYDPRRISLADRSVENGQDVEYRHFVLRYGLNAPPQGGSIVVDPSARLEPTERSLFISREIVGGRSSKAERVICFPRLEIPKDFRGEPVQVVSIQIESALHELPAADHAEGDTAQQALRSQGVDRFFFRVK